MHKKIIKTIDRGLFIEEIAEWIVPGASSPPNPNDIMLMHSGISKQDGSYIGKVEDVEHLIKLVDIETFEAVNGTTSGIGWSPKRCKWYGWSHRAIYGFGVGDIVKEGSSCATSGWTDELPVGFEAKTLHDAKKMAIAFHNLVS